ncbi:MAG: acetyl esterase [Thermoleophilaceae bacterium]|jgi:acetyl esterase|nr:acetyl esterase [Thermoleophilaceae bacterium]
MDNVAGRSVRPPSLESVEDVVAMRAFFQTELATPASVLPEGVERLEHLALRERAGTALTAELYVPKGEGPFPAMLWLHGGGWCAGTVENIRGFCMSLAERGILVASLDYGLAPEHPFPWAVEDAVYALRWLARNVSDFNGDGSRLAVGGASAGANLAAAATVALTSDDELVDGGDLAGVDVSLSAALFLYGIFDFPQMMLEPGSHAELVEMMFNMAYLGPHFLRHHRDPLVSPIYSEHLERFPATYFSCGARDSALDQSLRMARALAYAGVPTTASVVAGSDHSFVRLTPLPPRVTQEIERIGAWLMEETAPKAASE